MNTYRIKITLENGDEVQARSVGNNPQEAAERVIGSPQFKEFNQQWIGIKSIHYELEQEDRNDSVDASRYDFKPSTLKPGWYVVTDKQALVVVTFEKGKFNETQNITHLTDDVPEPLVVASTLKAIADYLRIHHPYVL